MAYKIKNKKKNNWKKITFDDGSFYYKNKKREGDLHIGEKSVSIRIDTVKIGNGTFPQTHIHEEFKNKPQALRYAKTYMKEHN
jgi:hypothetical protein